jgi:hypothetical protein
MLVLTTAGYYKEDCEYPPFYPHPSDEYVFIVVGLFAILYGLQRVPLVIRVTVRTSPYSVGVIPLPDILHLPQTVKSTLPDYFLKR